ncbi:unannotated protein [freshwater metagenome]|uniref:Unannotated protein n=1 Tax=freshwater metagenome TaxID=449393 RepID=A0A6J7GYH6_9ZZZZ
MSVPMSIVRLMIIDCDTCIKKNIECSECVVSFFIGAPARAEISPRVHSAITLLASREIGKELKFESAQQGQQTG